MDKRAYSKVVSPDKVQLSDSRKKFKVSTSPKKLNIESENDVNLLNFQDELNDELDGLCFDDDDEEFLMSLSPSLDLSSFKRCIVTDIEEFPSQFEKILTLREKKSSLTTRCSLKNLWYDTKVSKFDVVSVQGSFDADRQLFNVELIVTSPDTLISGTTVVGSLFCARKSVLAEKFRPLDTGEATAMHIGSAVHEILQTVMRRKFTELPDIQRVADEFMQCRDTLHLLFLCKMSQDDLKTLLDPFIGQIHEFVQQHIVETSSEFHISEVHDIEESVWCPRLGLKGKIDVTVTVNSQKLTPLEIKTGKASFSLEHKGQLILYQMMLRDLGKSVDSGLLLYIKEGIMKEVKTNTVEQRGLIHMRNRLAFHLHDGLNLPEPINHRSACARCEYNTVCCAFLSDNQLPPGHNLLEVKEKLISRLKPEHIEYFRHWCDIITAEHNEAQKSVKLRHIWTKSPEVRAAKGNALINLKLQEVFEDNEEFLTTFSGEIAASFEGGEYLIVSTDHRCSVAAGRVVKVDPVAITVALSMDLTKQYPDAAFHLDRYESQSQSVFNYSNIGALLEEKSEKLRRIIVDGESSVFQKTLSLPPACKQLLLPLNPHQRVAVLRALTCENFMLIKGLPGTGKTQTLVTLIRLLTMLKKTVLITSHTNSAVDNILLRLMDHDVKFMRLGSAQRINEKLRNFRESSWIENCKTGEELQKVYDEVPVVAVTCLGSSHALLTRRKFDYCLVDEATQIFQPTVIRPLLSAEKFVLVGDPKQLAPLVRSSVTGGGESLFERLDTPQSTIVLGLQYRMNRVITKLANGLTYSGELKCGTEKVEKSTIKFTGMAEKWLAKALSPHIDMSCALIDTGDVSRFIDNPLVNPAEAAIVFHIVELLKTSGISSNVIGVIAPYRSQVEALRKLLPGVEVNTVDQYQGRDKEIIVYSCTQSKAKEENGTEILEDRRRLTVAITRAKHKLIMIGDVKCLGDYAPFADLFKHLPNIAKVKVEEGKFGFSWDSLMEKVL